MLYEDRRLGGEPILTVGKPKDFDLRIPDRMLKCVCFLYVYGAEEGPERPNFGGTGFFVSMRGEQDDTFRHMYLVTAKHVVEESEKFGDLFVRYMTGHSDEMLDAPIIGEWTFHSDPAVDLAVMYFRSYPLVSEQSPRHPIPILAPEAVLTDEKQKRYLVGIGDDLAVVGLFTAHPGRKRNIPIVRHGTVAAMPGEPIWDEQSKEFYIAYLVEVRSIRGLSGSPVFLYAGTGRFPNGEVNETGFLFLAGVMRGHFSVRRPGQTVTDADRELMEMNTGIAMVTPISYLEDVLFGPELRGARLEVERAPSPDGGQVLNGGFSDPDEAAPSGPEPERLKIDAPMDEAVKKMFEAGKPPRE
jgi:hypothetical protein